MNYNSDNSNNYESDKEHVTGLLAINSFIKIIKDRLEKEPGRKDIAVIYLNIPELRTFNLNYGFAHGDEFLQRVASEITKSFTAENDLVARMGSRGFFIYTQFNQIESLRLKINSLQSVIKKYQRSMKMYFKIGIYIAKGDESGINEFLDRSRIACEHIMYNSDVYIQEYNDEIQSQIDFHKYIIDNFNEATEKGYIKPYYQTINRTITGKIYGFEALARWDDPVYGIITPAKFIAELERAHIIYILDLYIFECVCRDLRFVIDTERIAFPVSVNISRDDFLTCNVFEEIESRRKKYAIPVDLLKIEITENDFSSNNKALHKGIKELKEAGYKIWMDDFGTGYSSLNNLVKYDFDLVKIDMGFLQDLESEKKVQLVLSSIVSMIKNLGAQTLVEGIENEEQYEYIKKYNCAFSQGYYFSKPRTAKVLRSVYVDNLLANNDNIEVAQWNDYYNKIAEINVLSASPFNKEAKSTDNILPLAIVEDDEKQIKFIYINDSYIEFLESIRIPDYHNIEVDSEKLYLPENQFFKKMAEKSKESGNVESGEMVTNENFCRYRIKFLCEKDNRNCFMIIPLNLSNDSEYVHKEETQALMRHLFTLYFRVDVFDLDGTAENIYLNSTQGRITDQTKDAKEAARLYASKYIFEEERDKFIEFYDMTNVLERVWNSKENFLLEYFHSTMPGREGCLEMYTLLPVRIQGSWKVISCCRYVDDPHKLFDNKRSWKSVFEE